jgi:SAM-dependent methyltransferase
MKKFIPIPIINPSNGLELINFQLQLSDCDGNIFPIINGVPRIASLRNYTENFGVQWNKFDRTQFDREEDGLNLSSKRLFSELGCAPSDLDDKNILEVGSGAGRFSRVILQKTSAHLYSVDYSDAVTANYKNNSQIAPNRFHLFQASIYEMPFPDNSFDMVFCFGVLQHTPNFEMSIKSLINKAKPGGEVIVDFYPIKAWYTKIHGKYIFRPIAKKIPHAVLFKLIEANVDWLISVSKKLRQIGLGVFTRFLPLVDLDTIPSYLSNKEFREWVVLDTFDMFSPEHDHPQRIKNVSQMMKRYGADVTFSGFIEYERGFKAAVVRAVKNA